VAVGAAVRDRYVELLDGLGRLKTRAMFGGVGIYCDDVFFALIVGEDLYLKIDDQTQAQFSDAGSEPFVFQMKDGQSAQMRYWKLPDLANDDPDQARHWAALAVGAGLRARKPAKARASGHSDIGPGPWDG
jgi:DNA transformation protein